MIDSALIDSVLFVRWRERCDPADVRDIVTHTEAAHDEVGDRLVYVAIIPVGVPPPDARTRAALREGTQHAASRCSSVHVVIEGEGLRRALIRSVSAGLLLATRGSFHVHADPRAALDDAAKRVSLDVETILAQAAEQGLVARA